MYSHKAQFKFACTIPLKLGKQQSYELMILVPKMKLKILMIAQYYNLQNKEKGKSSNVEVPLASAFLEETVQFGIKSYTTTIHRIIGIL